MFVYLVFLCFFLVYPPQYVLHQQRHLYSNKSSPINVYDSLLVLSTYISSSCIIPLVSCLGAGWGFLNIAAVNNKKRTGPGLLGHTEISIVHTIDNTSPKINILQ